MKLFPHLCVLVLIATPAYSLVVAKATVKKCAFVQDCQTKAKVASKSCYDFMDFLKEKCGTVSTYCVNYEQDLVKACTAGFCKACLKKAHTAYEDCDKFYQTVIPNYAGSKTVCAAIKKELYAKCPVVCKDLKGITKDNPGKSCQDINEANLHLSGLYWIKPNGDASPVQAYCDMSFQGGGWTLASYGYVATTGYGVQDKRNKNIPNMNHPNGFNWAPTMRNDSNGLISLQHGAVGLARGAHSIIMAAGNNPVSGGIDGYSHVYMIDISQNPYTITFANHNRYHGGVGTSSIPKMHVVEFNVTALKGDSGIAKRYALGEALGISWGDTYPTGYGFSPMNAQYGSWSKGPFFPSVQSGDRPASGPCTTARPYPPDVQKGCSTYVHYGWHSLNGVKQTGQTSIWFK